MFYDIKKNKMLFSTPNCVRCGMPLSYKDDDISHTCTTCKCIK